ncbi:type I secretion protein, partial [Mesorhizobium sp. B2-9-1]
MATTTVSGSTVTFSNSGAAANLTQSGSEDGSLQFTFDVLAASGGGTKTTIYSVDDGTKNDDGGASITVTNKAFADYNKDLLIQDQAGIQFAETSTNGAKFWIGSDNKIHYDATGLSGQINALAAGQTFNDTIQYTIKMSNGTLSVGTLSVVITGTNDAVTITGATDTGTVKEDGTQTASGQLGFSDVDLSDSHTWSIDGVNGSAYGSIAVDQTGKWTYTLDNAAAQSLGAGDHLTETYTVKVDDGHGSTDTRTVTIHIDGTNDAVTITGATDTGTVKEDGTQTAS